MFAITVVKFQMRLLRMKAFIQRQNCLTPAAARQGLQFCIQSDTWLLWERHADISPWRKRSWKCCLSLRNVSARWNVVVFAKPWWQILASGSCVRSIIHSHSPETAAGCHYPALFEAHDEIVYAKTFQSREGRPGRSLPERWVLHNRDAAQLHL